ncbi:hypothetical protein MMC08_002409 [Hypocenomyce scalaris]|nr:hypothetical protein [Hypocenomyce scalaris]
MSLPTPPVALSNQCSIISNNTLYTYQPDAFQSLDLEEGGSWLQLPMGVSVTGASCVQGSSNGQEVLYIVGGTANASTPQYPGLQYYSFANNSWATVTPVVPVTQDRLRHGAAYLNSSSMILVYAGSQNGDWTPSSETFLISTYPPYGVQALSSDAPPVVSPLLLPFNQSHAVMLGGGSQNREVFTFGAQDGWQNLNVTLESGLKNSSLVQAAIVNGSDGSKVLELFDMSVSPNQITTALLQGATNSSTSGQQIGTLISSSSPTATHISTKPRRRDITLANWPAYNSTLAPHVSRDGFSLAQDSAGLVVISGGTDDSDPLCIFDQESNQWVNATQFLGDQSPTVLTGGKPSSTDSPVASLTAAASASSSTAAAASDANIKKNRSLTILGATLGAIFGFAALLILALCLLRCLRRRPQRNHNRSRSDYPAESKNNMDFADRGAEFMSEAGGTFGHKHKISGTSATSMAIMSGRATVGSPQSKRGFFHKPGDSGGSAKSFFSRGKSPLAPPPQPNAQAHSIGREVVAFASPEVRAEPRADNGWSRYFTNNSTTNLANMPPGYTRQDSNSRPTTYTSATRSDYTSGSRDPHESAEVPPLNIRSSQQALSSFPTYERPGSPTLGHTGLALTKEASPPPSSPSTLHTDDVSDLDEDDDEYNRTHGPQSEGMASWTPVATSDRGSTWEERPASSVYADSVIYPHPGEKVRIPNFPGVPHSARNSQVEQDSGVRRGLSVARDFAGSASLVPPPKTLTERGNRRVDDQHIRTFPKRPTEADAEATDKAGYYGQRRRKESETEDMSWLNLGK